MTFLEALTEEEAAALHAVGIRRTYGPNVTLFHEGDDAGSVAVLLEGNVKVVSLAAGRDTIVSLRGPGELLGELAAIDGHPRSASVTTIEPVEALLVPGSAFAALLERHPRVALVILRSVAGRLRDSDLHQVEYAGHDVLGRVARRLVDLSERFGSPAEGRIEIAMTLSQEDLAAVDGRLARGGEQGAPDAAGARRRGDGPAPHHGARPRGARSPRPLTLWRSPHCDVAKAVEAAPAHEEAAGVKSTGEETRHDHRLPLHRRRRRRHRCRPRRRCRARPSFSPGAAGSRDRRR